MDELWRAADIDEIGVLEVFYFRVVDMATSTRGRSTTLTAEADTPNDSGLIRTSSLPLEI
jgi:hypothetical protein